MGVPVLHCYADYKWTGPSEPIVRLCRELSGLGWRSDLACMAPWREGEGELARRAAAAGIAVSETFGFHRRRGLTRMVRDRRAILRHLADGDYGIVHCHGSWDHFVAGRAIGRSSAGMPLVRTDHGAREYVGHFLWRYYFGPRMIDHLIVLSDRYAVQAVNRLGLAVGAVTTVRGAVDTKEFKPSEAPPGMRERFGLAPEDVVIGVVARVQRHRRFGVLLAAAASVRRRDPRVKVVVCGRGTRRKQLLDRPVQKMGLQDTVIPLGYRREDYRDTLSVFDAGLMLVPGSDGSCRAALQMAAMGKPLIVAQRGVLPDIVRDGETGIVVDDTSGNLAEAMLLMAEDPTRRRRWGRAARQRMCARFSLSRQAEDVIRVYEKLL